MSCSRRFLADQMLGRLTRWLRVAGEDVADASERREAGTTDLELLQAARAGRRVVLTRRRSFPGTGRDRLIMLATDLEEQLVEFYRAFPGDPLVRAWSRCTVCNAPVEPVARETVLDRLPPKVRSHGRDFRRCTDCGHLFWEGSHTARIRERLTRVRLSLAAAPREAPRSELPGPAALAADQVADIPLAEPVDARAAERFDRLLRTLFARHSFSWRGYRKVRRRLRAPLTARLVALGLTSFSAYLDYLDGHEAERQRLNQLLAISVSRFFRDREDWFHLARVALPALQREAQERAVRALCLGCASGEEPFTLRLLWEDWVANGMTGPAANDATTPVTSPISPPAPSPVPPPPVDAVPPPALAIVAADIRADLLARARRAVYPPSSVHSVPPHLLECYFSSIPDGYRLAPEVVESVSFVRLDFYEGEIPGPVDLLLCRNSAFTYLAPARLTTFATRLRAAVRPGGFLFLGGGEAGTAPPGLLPAGRCLWRRPPPESPE